MSAVSSGAGAAATVFVYNDDGSLRFGLMPYGDYQGGCTVAVGDVNGDKINDIITGAGPGAPGGHVKVFNGADGSELRSFFAFPDFSGGVSVAAGDVDADGRADIIVGAGPGADSHVAVFRATDNLLIRSFDAYASYGGGVQVAAGDVNGDGAADILTGAGPGAPGGHVKVFNGKDSGELRSFFAFPGFTGGVSVAAGDIDGDGRADPIVGAGPGADSHVAVFRATDNVLIRSFDAYAGFGGGVRVGAADVNGDHLADIITGAGPGAGPHVKVFDGATGNTLESFFAFDSFGGGVFVGGAGPLTPFPAAGSSTITDLYAFRSPANANNTVLIMNFEPFPGNVAPATADPTLQYDIKIDNHDILAATEDITLRTTFSAPDINGVQDVTLSEILASNPGVSIPLAQGRTGLTAPTGLNVPIAGGGTFRSGIHDEPFFFDQAAFENYLSGGAFPRPPGAAHNFYGPNGNTFSIIIEVPSTLLRGDVATNPNGIVSLWATIGKNGVQLNRFGRPLFDEGLIPPVPRSNLSLGDQRAAFEASQPSNDNANFRGDLFSILVNFYGRTPADANFLADALLPDVLIFQLGNPNGFGTTVGPGPGSPGPFPGGQYLGNGRRLHDDVVDIELNFITNGAKPGDNVGDDNGLKVTDGSVDPVSGKTRAIAFPYMGLANLPLNGPGTGPNP